MIDKAAFHSLTYGLYIISSKADGRAAGCVVNTFQQVTSSPLQVSVALNKENATTDVVRSAGRFAAVCLSEEVPMELIGTFGFHCSNDCDKFATCVVDVDASGIPYVAEQGCARFSARVVQEVDLGTHVLFVAEVEEAERLGANTAEPITYAYYHKVKGGKTPPKASSYLSEDGSKAAVVDAATATTITDASNTSADNASTAPKYAWRCTICGHIEYVEELPDDYVCPVCGVGKDLFERIVV